jgi:hypothetical protein
MRGKWTTSNDGLIYVVGGSVVGTVDKSCHGRLTRDDCYHSYGCMSDWQDTDLGVHGTQMEARKAVTDWVKENQ